MTIKIDVFVDYVCPFCFLVEPAIEALKRDRQRADQDYAVHEVGIDAVPGIVVEGVVLRGLPSATRLKKVVDDLTEHKTALGLKQS